MIRRLFTRFAGYIYRDFPARKFFGCVFASIGGAFACAFLSRSLWEWTPIPENVLGVIGILTGGFGAYMASSSYEAVRKHDDGKGEE